MARLWGHDNLIQNKLNKKNRGQLSIKQNNKRQSWKKSKKKLKKQANSTNP
jgi:hypothetical protein